jgi:hypothetical protein
MIEREARTTTAVGDRGYSQRGNFHRKWTEWIHLKPALNPDSAFSPCLDGVGVGWSQ